MIRAPFQAASALALALTSAAVAAPDLGLPSLSDKDIAAFREATDKAGAALEKGNRAGAIRAYDRALGIHAGNDGHWYNRACLSALEGRADAALADLERALGAGWTDARWPLEDGDLATLRELPAFKAWVERVAARTPAATDWDVPERLLPATAEALDAEAEAAVAGLRRLRGVIGTSERERAEAALLAWRAASWAHLAEAATEPAVAAQQRLSELEVLAGRDATGLSEAVARRLVERAEAYVAAHAGNEHEPAARLFAIEARHALVPHEVKHEEPERLEAASRAFERGLLGFVATHEAGAAVERALTRLIGLEGDSDRALALALLERLRRQLGGDEAKVRGLVTATSRSAYYELAGLPPFSVTTLDGRTVTPESLKGRVTLIDFWATWCGPCREELPHLKAAYAKYHALGFDVLGISLDDAKKKDASAFQAWCAENGVTWPQVYDGKFWEAELAKLFNVQGIPFPLLVDREGRVVATDADVRGAELERRIAELLGSGAETRVAVGQ